MWFANGLAVVSILISVVGIYSGFLRTLIERRREFEIRLAIGASPAHLVRLIARDAAVIIAFGTSLGVAIGTVVTRFLEHQVGWAASDFGPMLLGAAVVLVVAFCAVLPACYRASRFAVIETLR